MSKTSLALSNLRGVVILVVVAFHSCIAYLAWHPQSARSFDTPPYDWTGMPIIDGARWLGFDLFCALQYLYLMQLMFFLSGLFVWPSLVRKGSRKFLRDRLVRLGLPFVLGVYLLMPVFYYPAYRATAVDPGWSAFWSHWMALPFWPSGPLWFLWVLLVLNFAAAALHALSPRADDWLGDLAARADAHPRAAFLALIAGSGVAYVPMAALFEPWQWTSWGPFSFQPSFLPQYVIYFFAGLTAGAQGLGQGLIRSDGALARRWLLWLAGVPVGFFLWMVPTALIVNGQAAILPGLPVLADLGFVLASATSCMAFVALFLRFATGRRPILDSLSENAYAIYVVHYGFVVWLQYSLLGLATFAMVKAAIVFTGSVLMSWAVAAAVGRIPLGSRAVRMAHGRVSAPAPVPRTRPPGRGGGDPPVPS
ncbi:MAG TPA: acyltransferase [Xanthobacteraceae bacterium]